MKLNLRPHHIYCTFFSDFKDLERREEFKRTYEEVKNTLRNGENATIKFDEKGDMVCKVCDHCDPDEEICVHPEGGEKEVQKWDHKILKELDKEIGDEISVNNLRVLIEKKHPLKFCKEKCPYMEAGECNPYTML